MTGTRTQVQLTRSCGRCMILRPSFCIFISSLEYPWALNPPICGIRLQAIGYWKVCRCRDLAAFAERLHLLVSSSRMPPTPAPLTAW